MRTDGDPDRHESAADDGEGGGDEARTGSGRAGPRVSRRAFVLAAASAGAATVGTARGTGTESARRLEVAASEPYRRTVSGAVRSFERAVGEFEVGLRASVPDAVRGLLDGDVDVYVSGRPTLAPGGEPDDGVERAVTPAGWAVLTHDDAEWRECLSRQAVRDRWAADAPVETWSETDWDSVAAVARPAGRDARAGRRAARGRDDRDAAWTTLVRGTRSFQYARGRGGVGYYGVERDAITVEPAGTAARSENRTPLVRLGYVHAGRSSLGRGVAAFLGHLRRGRAGSDGVAYYADPAVEDADAAVRE